VRERSQLHKKKAHESMLARSETFRLLQRMRDELKRSGRLDKPAIEFFIRCRAVIGQGTELDRSYLFRLIRSNSEVTTAVQDLIDVLLCELQVPLPGFLMWCLAHNFTHDKVRVDDVLEAREDQRKRRRRKCLINCKAITGNRRRHRFYPEAVEQQQDAMPDRTFLTQAQEAPEAGMVSPPRTLYPKAPEQRRAEPKGKERWRQALRSSLQRTDGTTMKDLRMKVGGTLLGAATSTKSNTTIHPGLAPAKELAQLIREGAVGPLY